MNSEILRLKCPLFDMHGWTLQTVVMRSRFAALGLIFLTTSWSPAAIIYTDIADVVVPVSSTQFLALDLNGDAPTRALLLEESSDFSLYEVLIQKSSSEYIEFTAPSAGTYGNLDGFVHRLNEGDFIPDSNDLSWVGGNTYLKYEGDGLWNGTSGTAYAGVLFALGSDLFSGWVHLSYDDATGSLSVLGFAYEDTPNTGLLIVPEPSSSLLALLSGALLCLRRRKR